MTWPGGTVPSLSFTVTATSIGARSGLDWITGRDYIKINKASGIVDLIKRVVTVSARTAEIVAGLPSLEQTIARLRVGAGR